jgi:hypothetical protein
MADPHRPVAKVRARQPSQAFERSRRGGTSLRSLLAFTVLSAAWNAGTAEDPHEIELLAAADNKEAREDLPLAPWS